MATAASLVLSSAPSSTANQKLCSLASSSSNFHSVSLSSIVSASPSLSTSRQSRSSRKATSVTRSMIREWPDPDFIAETKAAFPEKAIANVEEARVLYETGYTYLDVRPALELEEVGKVRNSVNVPFMNAKWKYNAEERKKEVEKTPNNKFIEQIKKKFPNKEHPLLVGCSDGRKYSIDALRALDAEGYTNLVALRGGFYAWFRVFDNKLNRRYNGDYNQVYDASGDSCGIHSTGAGFEKMDSMDPWIPRF